MRYMLYDANREFVLLSDEINYLRNYIDLQRIRLENPEHILLKVEGDAGGIKIAPMLFIPFIENMFKHGNKSTDSPGFIIGLKITSSEIHFQTQNSIRTTPGSSDETKGIGIKNVKRRLALIYPNHHKLDINKQNNIFTVDLKLTLLQSHSK
jgi:LytS/YehU family sensor histidine kinase